MQPFCIQGWQIQEEFFTRILLFVQVDNLQLLEEDTSQVTQVVPDGESPQAMQVSEENAASSSGHTVQEADGIPTAEADATSALQALQYAGMF